MARDAVRSFYGSPGLLDKVLSALVDIGLDPDRLSQKDLAPIDQFHIRGRTASAELLKSAKFEPASHILDVGSGIGGPARFLACHGLRVTGIDLTPEFVVVAKDLTRRVGLDSSTSFVEGSALAMPFEDSVFDGAWMQHIGMNVSDKPGLFASVARVSRLGGRLALQELVAGPNGEPDLPTPWASEPSGSFMVGAAKLRRTAEGAGWEVETWRDDTALALASYQDAMSRRTGKTPLNLRAMFDERYVESFRNLGTALADGRCEVVTAVMVRA